MALENKKTEEKWKQKQTKRNGLLLAMTFDDVIRYTKIYDRNSHIIILFRNFYF